MVRVPASAAWLVVRDEMQGIGRPGIFGDGCTVKIRLVPGIHRYIFQDAAKAVDGGPDQGFKLRVEADSLGVAASFEVEDAVIAPAVFVIADQNTVRVAA